MLKVERTCVACNVSSTSLFSKLDTKCSVEIVSQKCQTYAFLRFLNVVCISIVGIDKDARPHLVISTDER